MKVGYSLSMCLRSVAKGEVSFDDVLFIMASTAYRSREECERGVRETLMGRDVELHVERALTLWDEGRIFQASVRQFHRPSYAQGEIWRDALPGEIEWMGSAG